MKRNNIDRCRSLRRSQTDAERKLWQRLRNRQIAETKFRRQFPVGRYILDFYSPQHKLGIEADGGGHYQKLGRQRDKLRAEGLSKLGVKILRFTDLDNIGNYISPLDLLTKVRKSKQGGQNLPKSLTRRADFA